MKAVRKGETIFEDVIYAEAYQNRVDPFTCGVILRNIIGEKKDVGDCRIVKVDIPNKTITLSL